MALLYGQLGSSCVKSAIAYGSHTFGSSEKKLDSVSSVSGWMLPGGGGPMRVDHTFDMI